MLYRQLTEQCVKFWVSGLFGMMRIGRRSSLPGNNSRDLIILSSTILGISSLRLADEEREIGDLDARASWGAACCAPTRQKRPPQKAAATRAKPLRGLGVGHLFGVDLGVEFFGG